MIHQMEWGTILASPITSASQPNSSQGFRVLGFHGSIPVLSGVMHQSQTQRLTPNKHCCWELASPFFAAIHHQHGGFDQQQNMVIWVVYSWLISIFLMEIAIFYGYPSGIPGTVSYNHGHGYQTMSKWADHPIPLLGQ